MHQNSFVLTIPLIKYYAKKESFLFENYFFYCLLLQVFMMGLLSINTKNQKFTNLHLLEWCIKKNRITLKNPKTFKKKLINRTNCLNSYYASYIQKINEFENNKVVQEHQKIVHYLYLNQYLLDMNFDINYRNFKNIMRSLNIYLQNLTFRQNENLFGDYLPILQKTLSEKIVKKAQAEKLKLNLEKYYYNQKNNLYSQFIL